MVFARSAWLLALFIAQVPSIGAAQITPSQQMSLLSDYDAAKAALTAIIGEGPGNAGINLQELGGCESFVSFGETRVPALLGSLAQSVATLSVQLRALGAPLAQTMPMLDEYERESLVLFLTRGSEGSDAMYEAYLRLGQTLADILNASRGINQPRVVFMHHCGGTELPVIRFVLEPAGGVLQIITRFNYLVCTTANRRPYDDPYCNALGPSLSNAVIQVNGNYMYRVRWPDGRVSEGRVPYVPHDQFRVDWGLNPSFGVYYTIEITPNGVRPR